MHPQAERVQKILDLYNSSISGFEKKCGLSSGAIYLPLKRNTHFSSNTLDKISFYTPFNRKWIENGTGDIFRTDLSIYDNILRILYEEGSDIKSFERKNGNTPGTFKNALIRNRKFSDMVAWAEDLKEIYPDHDYSWIYQSSSIGTKQQSSKSSNKDDSMDNYATVIFKYFPDYDSIFEANDNAMSPRISNGDTAICKTIDPNGIWAWNKMYLVETANGSFIRRVKPGECEEEIRCIADDSNYETIIVKKSEIIKAAAILGAIKTCL